VTKYDTFNEEFKSRNNLTAKALGEVFSYIDNIKKDINNIQYPDGKTHQSANASTGLKPAIMSETAELANIKNEILMIKSKLNDSLIAANLVKDAKSPREMIRPPPVATQVGTHTDCGQKIVDLTDELNMLRIQVQRGFNDTEMNMLKGEMDYIKSLVNQRDEIKEDFFVMKEEIFLMKQQLDIMKANKGSETEKKVSLTEFQDSLNIQVKILQNDVNYLKDFATGKLNKPSEKDEVTKFEFDLHKKMMIDLISKSATRDELDCYATKKALSEYLTSHDAKHRFITTDQLEALITREELMGLSPMKKSPNPESPQKILRQPTAQQISLMTNGDLSQENQFWKEEISRQVKDLNQEINIIKYEKLGDDAHTGTLFGITNA
jgi:thymidine kinase